MTVKAVWVLQTGNLFNFRRLLLPKVDKGKTLAALLRGKLVIIQFLSDRTCLHTWSKGNDNP